MSSTKKKGNFFLFLIDSIKSNPILSIVMFIGCFFRLFYIGNIPANNNLYIDEMYSAYESWAMLHYGHDSLGYHMPMYLKSWGSGMTSFTAYLQMPFIAIFGLNSFAVRLPVAILGCITLYAFYYICKKIRSHNFALFATFILAIMPWHIMMNRWALDCNTFVGMITISLALLLKASENNKFLPLAAFFYGLTLYSYALPWSVMPLIVLGSVIYLMATKRIRFEKYFLISGVIFVILVIPAFLFLLVNNGYIDEIKTAFFSVPKMTHFRTDEIDLSIKGFIKSFHHTLSMFASQDDGRVSDVTPGYGLFYKFSGIFILIGIAHSLIHVIEEFKEKKKSDDILIWLEFAGGIIIGMIVVVYFSRINLIMIPITFFLADGLYFLAERLGGASLKVIVAVYAVSFLAFISYYFTIHDDVLAEAYFDGTEAAINYINEVKSNGDVAENAKIHALSGLSYLHVMYYDKFSADRYMTETEFIPFEYTQDNLVPKSVGDYDFTIEFMDLPLGEPVPGDIYVCKSHNEEEIRWMENHGMNITYHSYIAVGIN